MKSRALTLIKYGFIAFVIAVAISQTNAFAQTPILPDGNKIEGAWDSQITYKSCTTGAVLFTGQSFYIYAQGGVLTAITTGASPSLRSPGLGVWRHVGGRDYESTFKEFRYNADGALTGKVIVVVQITHEPDDTLTTNAVGTFYNAAGVVTSRICPTGVATRFTGEN